MCQFSGLCLSWNLCKLFLDVTLWIFVCVFWVPLELFYLVRCSVLRLYSACSGCVSFQTIFISSRRLLFVCVLVGKCGVSPPTVSPHPENEGKSTRRTTAGLRECGWEWGRDGTNKQTNGRDTPHEVAVVILEKRTVFILRSITF